MIVAAVVLTGATLYGIKIFVGGGSEEYSVRGSQDPFKQEAAEEQKAGPRPEIRAASSMMGGDSLGMFAKTNAGYAGEEEEEGEAPVLPSTAPSKAAAAKASADAAAARAVSASPRQGGGQTIPRLQPVKPFGSSGGTQGLTGQQSGGGRNAQGKLPDIGEIVSKTRADAEQKTQDMKKKARSSVPRQ